MSSRGDGTAAPPATLDRVLAEADASLYRFLRCGHILGSLLREILEESYLSQRCSHPLTRTQFCLLKLISVNADVQPSEVARYLGVTPAAVTKNVDKLEGLGLVNRDPCAEDRRATLLSASEEGARVVGEYEDLKAARISPVVKELEPAELDELCELLEGLCVDLVRHGRLDLDSCMRCAGYYSEDCLVGLEQGGCALQPQGRLKREDLA
jgi:DNA-binding MarR family transcriptional regulator